MGYELIEDINEPTYVSRKERTTSRTLNYHERLIHGEPIPPQPYNASTRKREAPYANLWVKLPYGPKVPQDEQNAVNNSLLSLPPDYTLGGITAEADLQAQSRLSDRAADSKFLLGVTMLEARKTISMVASAAERIGGSYSALKKGRISEAFDALIPHGSVLSRRKSWFTKGHSKLQYYRKHRIPEKALSNAWLELQYGWKPLLYDIDNAMEALANTLHKNSYDLTLRGSASSKKQFDVTTPIHAGSFKGQQTYVYRGKVRRKYTYNVRGIEQDQRAYNAIGMQKPGLVLWELSPYSFVVDWFIPVGAYLNALSYPQNLEIVSGCYSTKTDVYRSMSKSGYINWNGYTYTGVDGDSFDIETISSFSRKLVNNWPAPSLPRLDLATPLGTTRLLSALALLNSLR